MKKILVPTDFSATAKCAMTYAQILAAEIEGGQIDVVHLYLPATAAEYPNIVPPIPEFVEAREKCLLNLWKKAANPLKEAQLVH
ncbi:MAG: universal stress protein [Haliscomenobacter sp.]|nr:universal stress protein [Haliscomenobacter sp.]